MIYLYGLLFPEHPLAEDALAGLTGLQGALQYAAVQDWILIYEHHDGSEVLPRRRNMLTHTRNLEKAMTFGTVLPARFGLVAEDLAAVTRLVIARQERIATEFARLCDCVELSLRVKYPKDAALTATLNATSTLLSERDRLVGRGPEAHFARAEFGRRLAEAMDRRRASAQKALIAGLRAQVVDHVLRKPESDTEVLRVEVLVKASQQQRLLAHLEDLLEECAFAPGAEPTVTVVGPAPLYNFVRLSLALDESQEDAA